MLNVVLCMVYVYSSPIAELGILCLYIVYQVANKKNISL